MSWLRPTWRDCLLVAIVATAVAAAWHILVPVAFYTDSWGYYQYARFFDPATRSAGGIPSHRAPGLPIFILLTGATRWNTFAGLLAAQFAMAVAIPVLAYLIVQPFHRRAALAAAVLTILTMIPFLYQKWVMTEQLYLFLTFLVAFLLSRLFLKGAHGALFMGVALAAAALALTKPQGALVFWLSTLICALALPRLWAWILPGVLLFMGVMLLWAMVDRSYLLRAGAYPEILGMPTGGDRWVADLYYQPWRRCFEKGPPCTPVIKASAGPASTELYRIVAEAAANYAPSEGSDAWLRPPSMFLMPAKSHALRDAIWQRPHFVYWNFITGAIDKRLGTEERARLMRQVASEHSNRGLVGAVRFLIDNPTSVFLGGGPRASGYNLFWQFYGPGRSLRTLSIARPTRLISAGNGPASRIFFDELRRHLVAFPGFWTQNYPEFSGRPDALIDEFFERPSFTHLWRFWNLMAHQLGHANADLLFRLVAQEALAHHPEAFLVFWDNFVTASFGPEAISDDGYRLLALPHIGQTQYVPPEMPSALRRELLATNDGRGPPPAVFEYLYQLAHILKPVYLLLVVLGLSTLWASPARCLAIWIVAVTALHIAVISVYGSPTFRYMDAIVLLPLILAVLGCAMLGRGVRERAENLDRRH